MLTDAEKEFRAQVAILAERMAWLTVALSLAIHKLMLYQAHSSDEHPGGMEYEQLMKTIVEAPDDPVTADRAASQQAHILSQATSTEDNRISNALAGTGKTRTLEFIQAAARTKPVLYLCFNKRIAEEAEKKFPSTTQVRTLNSLGHRIWALVVPKKLALDPKKTQTQYKELVSNSPKTTQSVLWDCYWEVVQGVAMAKALGYVPGGKFPNARRLIQREAFHARLDEVPDDLTADLIDELLFQSIKSAYEGFIDYNDQVYMPALFGGTFPRFPLVKVDEAQDLSPCNHAMLDKLVRHRFIAVGDPWQSIYGFRGAKQNGMGELQQKHSMTGCDLSVSFRCPRAVVEASRWRVPHFKWVKEGGHVEGLDSLHSSNIPDNGVFICRNNAPLFRLALNLLASKRSVTVLGSDIGPKIVSMMKKLGDERMKADAVEKEIDKWLDERLKKGSKSAKDLAECMRVFASFGKTLGEALSYAEHLFKQQGAIRLMTGHKAKGLEFSTVFHLDPWLIGDDEQEKNLRYVITTRSMDRLFEVNSANIRWNGHVAV